MLAQLREETRLLLLDSTNGDPQARRLYVLTSGAERVVAVNMQMRHEGRASFLLAEDDEDVQEERSLPA